MSPEGMAHAMGKYVESLKHQAEIAEAFFFGRVAEGIEGLLTLPEPQRLRVDQLIWEKAGGEAIDPPDEASREFIADAILFSIEEQMGMHE